MQPKVFLIGGAPGAGKTTLGMALAARLGIGSISADDLMTAARAAASPNTHPGLWLMPDMSHQEYFTHTPVEKLQADASRQHSAAWPVIKSVIRKHAVGGSPIVIDGWHIWPSRVNKLGLENVWAGWIVCEPGVLEARERSNTEWLHGSDAPDQMLENFIARSLWFNDLIKEQAVDLNMNTLRQSGSISVDTLVDIILAGL